MVVSNSQPFRRFNGAIPKRRSRDASFTSQMRNMSDQSTPSHVGSLSLLLMTGDKKSSILLANESNHWPWSRRTESLTSSDRLGGREEENPSRSSPRLLANVTGTMAPLSVGKWVRTVGWNEKNCCRSRNGAFNETATFQIDEPVRVHRHLQLGHGPRPDDREKSLWLDDRCKMELSFYLY